MVSDCLLPAGSLMYLNEATLLHNIKVRYSKDRIYVSTTCHERPLGRINQAIASKSGFFFSYDKNRREVAILEG